MKEKMYSKFSENLNKALIEGHISQQVIADNLGTTQQTVSRWVKGLNEPDYDTLMKLCVFLGETPDSLLGFNETLKKKEEN